MRRNVIFQCTKLNVNEKVALVIRTDCDKSPLRPLHLGSVGYDVEYLHKWVVWNGTIPLQSKQSTQM